MIKHGFMAVTMKWKGTVDIICVWGHLDNYVIHMTCMFVTKSSALWMIKPVSPDSDHLYFSSMLLFLFFVVESERKIFHLGHYIMTYVGTISTFAFPKQIICFLLPIQTTVHHCHTAHTPLPMPPHMVL